MTDCYLCKEPIDVKTQGKIELSIFDEKAKKFVIRTFHYKADCTKLIKK